MATNEITQEPTTKHYKQIREETRTFKTFEDADACRLSIKGVLKENEKVRVKYRRERNEYDVLWFRR